VIGPRAARPGLCWHDDRSLGPLSRLRALDSALQACASLCRPVQAWLDSQGPTSSRRSTDGMPVHDCIAPCCVLPALW
jgi:hypothetical protein